MKKTIDMNQAQEALEYAVKLKGANYVYPRKEDGPSCTYVRDGEPSCIAGVALAHLGVPIAGLEAMDETINGGVYVDDVLVNDPYINRAHVLLKEHGFEFTRAAVLILTEAQQTQDNNGTWGRAVELSRNLAVQYSDRGMS